MAQQQPNKKNVGEGFDPRNYPITKSYLKGVGGMAAGGLLIITFGASLVANVLDFFGGGRDTGRNPNSRNRQ